MAMVTTQTQPSPPSTHVREREDLKVNICWADSYSGGVQEAYGLLRNF